MTLRLARVLVVALAATSLGCPIQWGQGGTHDQAMHKDRMELLRVYCPNGHLVRPLGCDHPGCEQCVADP
jgi:hypothetical protein